MVISLYQLPESSCGSFLSLYVGQQKLRGNYYFLNDYNPKNELPVLKHHGRCREMLCPTEQDLTWITKAKKHSSRTQAMATSVQSCLQALSPQQYVHS